MMSTILEYDWKRGASKCAGVYVEVAGIEAIPIETLWPTAR